MNCMPLHHFLLLAIGLTILFTPVSPATAQGTSLRSQERCSSALSSARAAVTTKSSGKRFTLKVNGVDFPGNMQIENEFRMNIPSQNLNPQKVQIGDNVELQPYYENVEELAGELMKSELGGLGTGLHGRTHVARGSIGFSFQALAMDQRTYHAPNGNRANARQFKGSEKVGDTTSHDPMTKFLKFEARANYSEDFIEVKSRIGYQRELGTYFDTKDHRLRKKKIAVRLKRWYPGDTKSRDLDQPVAQMLFLKRTVNLRGLLTVREEWQVPLPINLSSEDIRRVAAKLIEKAADLEIAPEEMAALDTVDTTRLGLNLIAFNINRGFSKGSGHQIGFLTLDRYRVYPGDIIPSARAMREFSEQAQIEIEIFPDSTSQQIYQRHSQAFGKVLDYLEKVLGGQRTTRPKYETGLSDPS